MKRGTRIITAALLCAALCVTAQGRGKDAEPLTLVSTNKGVVKGSLEDGLGTFKAIPFAEAPVGELRWKAPVAKKAWEGVLDATEFGGMPPQQTRTRPGGPKPKVSEDCLYLNIQTPARSDKEKLPVLVWIHGGGFITGDANSNNGAAFAKQGIVFVSLSYRTGALGFLSLPELSAENERGISGNYGLLDMIEGLKWVQENIAAFGGDPEKVTIMGESAGAIAVSMLCASPLAKGLFRGAISESGGSFCPVDSIRVNNNGIRDMAGSERFGLEFMKRIGASSLEELRQMDWEKWVGDSPSIGVGGFWPCVDGYVLPDDQYIMYSQGKYNDVNVLIGTNSDEGSMFCRPVELQKYLSDIRAEYGPFADRMLEAYPAASDQETFGALSDIFRETAFSWPTWAWANLQNRTGKGKVYMYYFDQFDPDRSFFGGPGAPKPRGAGHASELQYVFASPWGRPFEGGDKTVSEAMNRYWANFVKTGDPNGEGLENWPVYKDGSKSVIYFKNGCSLIETPNKSQLLLMEDFYKWKRENSAAQKIGSKSEPELNLLTDSWKARWISFPDSPEQGYGVYRFSKELTLDKVPSEYRVNVSGDNRYKLYINGTLVSLGPAKGDATHWNYESVDIAPQLRKGNNTISALVYHEGDAKPDSQISVSVGFILQGEGEAADLYTDSSWICCRDNSYSPLSVAVPGYYVAGPGEKIDYRIGMSEWTQAKSGRAGEPKNLMSSNQGDGHNLIRSTLPQMELSEQRLSTIRKSEGIKLSDGFLEGKKPLVIPASSKVELLLDNQVLTNAYFNLAFSGGKDARISIAYAESLYNPDPEWKRPSEEQLASMPERFRSFALTPRTKGKGKRNEVDGKIFLGREDVLIPDGQFHLFTTLSWRTYRYVRLQIETAQDALEISDLWGTFTGYPFVRSSSLDTDRQDLKNILDIGWRTARLCATETYMDCPYYERLQYLGDTRIQALITLYNSSDDRLVKNFLYLSDISRNADGITKSRYPTTLAQYIQPYALSYIYALHDYMMYGADTDFVLQLLPGAEQIIEYFKRFQQEDGRLKNLPGWNFSDWVNGSKTWNYGAPFKGADGCSINMDLQLLYAYQLMAEMESFRGNKFLCDEYGKMAEKMAQSVKRAYWNGERGLFADRSEQDNYSQHGNALAILCGIADDPKALALKLLSDTSLNQCSVYYKFYLHEALVKAGLGESYLDWLGVWYENMDMGLTTWGETSDVNSTRSDCHAWGSSPNIELFRTVLGIDSAAPGFGSVRIAPHLGDIQKIGGSIPHPKGEISVQYSRTRKGIKAEITLPRGISGSFVWDGKEYPLQSGVNAIKI